jgi:TRAP transporter TAXI family solute receptor
MARIEELSSIQKETRRRRRPRSKLLLFVLLSGVLVFAAAATVLLFALRPVTLRVAVGPPGSDDAKLIQALAQNFARERGHIRLLPITTDGAIESISLFSQSKADLAVARGDLEMPNDAQSVAILRKNVVVIWAPPSIHAKGAKRPTAVKIKSLEDLTGHRVGVIGRTKANVTLLNIILQESGISPAKVEIVQFATTEIAEMNRDQTIAAFVAVGPLTSKITADAIAATARARGEPKFIAIDVGDAIAQKHPLYESEEIPGSTFSTSPARPDDKIDTVGVNHLIVAHKSLSEATVGAFARELFAARQTLLKEMPEVSKIETPDTDKDAALPAHRGAAAFIDGTERTFLEKYSDYMWGGILLLSGLGSAGAWFRSYLKKDETSHHAMLRDRLLDMIGQARQADTVEELDKMQAEVDDILRDTLDCFEDGAIEEGALSAFGLALEQFHQAVAYRKSRLGGHSANLISLAPQLK